MKATPSVVKTTAAAQLVSKTGPGKTRREPAIESIELSQEKLRDRAFSSTQVMDEILGRNNHSYSFRHWGINE
jgi:hypothetical protein